MSQNHYKLYSDSVLELAETLVIKSEYSALRINDDIKLRYGPDKVVDHLPQSWKYYLNVCGEYHFTDQVMRIVSLDTMQEIDFTKANLIAHPYTARAYQYNSRYWRELILRYPEQEQLVSGILFPADMDTAIKAKDFTVLAYPKHLVEDNEMSLIPKINEWLEKFNIRWNNQQFTLSDDLYGASLIALMYLQLIPLIFNLRLRACKTEQAHSFHVRQYLASHGMLDVYLTSMTKKQALFFYRNILYLERNPGTKDTFEWLVEKVMTDRGMPLSEFNMQHNTQAMPESLTPDVSFTKRLVNATAQHFVQSDTSYDIYSILRKEAPLTRGNPAFINDNQAFIKALFEHSASGSLPTKVLESSTIDYSDALPYTLHEAYLNHWVSLSNTGQFDNVFIRIKSPRTGQELVMNTQDAYVYYLYAYAQSVGVTLDKIPLLFAQRVIRHPVPGLSDLLKIVNQQYVTVEDAQWLFDNHTDYPQAGFYNIEEYRQFCKDVHRTAMRQLYYVYNKEALSARGMMYAMVHRLYEDVFYPSPEPLVTYPEWIDFRGLEYKGYTRYDWERVHLSIYQAMTGVDMNAPDNVNNVQKAMIALLTQLSSYSIQIVSDTQSMGLKSPNWSMVRVEHVTGSGTMYQQILLGIFTIFKKNVYPYDYLRIELEKLLKDFIIENPTTDGGFIDVPIDVFTSEPQNTYYGVVDLGIFRLNQDSLPLSVSFESYGDIPNYQAYFQLTDVEKANIKNIYCECAKIPYTPQQVNMLDIITNPALPGFEYLRTDFTYVNAFEYAYIPEYDYSFTRHDIHEMDAFIPNTDPTRLDVFNLNYGHHGVPSFTIVDQIPPEVILPPFNLSGGQINLSVFSRARKGDHEHILTDMKAFYHTHEFSSFKASYIYTAINGFRSVVGAKQLTLRSLYQRTTLGAFAYKRYASVSLTSLVSVAGQKEMQFRSTVGARHLSDMVFLPMTSVTMSPFKMITSQSQLSDMRFVTHTVSLSKMRTMTRTTRFSSFTWRPNYESILYEPYVYNRIQVSWTLRNVISSKSYDMVYQKPADVTMTNMKAVITSHELSEMTFVPGQGIV